MADDLETTFNSIDKLLGLTPFFKCPKCGRREEIGDKGATYFNIFLQANIAVEVNDARKTFEGKLTDLEILPDNQKDLSIMCGVCGHEFPLPEGWKWEIN